MPKETPLPQISHFAMFCTSLSSKHRFTTNRIIPDVVGKSKFFFNCFFSWQYLSPESHCCFDFSQQQYFWRRPFWTYKRCPLKPSPLLSASFSLHPTRTKRTDDKRPFFDGLTSSCITFRGTTIKKQRPTGEFPADGQEIPPSNRILILLYPFAGLIVY